jgi:hypothetical protein
MRRDTSVNAGTPPKCLEMLRNSIIGRLAYLLSHLSQLPANASTFSLVTWVSGAMTRGSNGADSGSAARFFYCAKASKSDREDGNTHPTVKPTTLMRYLCRLVTPKGGTVLDPFTGSGSTGKAALLEGFNFVGIEREAEYVAIAKARIGAAQQCDPFQ